MITRLRALVAVLLVLAVLLTWWLKERVAPAPGPPPVSVPEKVDYYLEGFTLTAMRPDGSRHYRLRARRMTHYPDEDVSRLRAPRLSFYDPPAAPWEVRSERGRVSGDGERVWLTDDVRVTREGSPENRPLRLETSALLVRPEDAYGETDRPVRLRSAALVARATGLRAHLGRAYLELLSEVTSRYAARAP
ncbi:MAG: LPS export ABC transporter periplasmic protein LptC [Gammaproteobacteria bacterium]|nr:LPS export ABC transporter periplasmic protein LptC [Gammaproteobacteria bacterium]